jgi:hypothetical protein
MITETLRTLADIWEKPENAALQKPALYVWCSTKQELLAVIRAIGGKFTKTIGTGEYAYITLVPDRAPELRINISRDRVCRKIVKWECEPLLLPEEEREIDLLAEVEA